MVDRPMVENAPERTYESVMPEFNPEGSLLRQLQLRIVDIVVEVDKICRKHNLRYWICSGTLLGAVRHGGFIPWDDDLDIEMPREDYNKLIRILPDELPKNLVLQSPETDPDYYTAHVQIRDLDSRIRDKGGIDRLLKYKGVFIDIFPIEKSNDLFRFIAQKSLGFMYNMLRKPSYSEMACRRWVRFIRGVTQNLMFPIFRVLSYLGPRTPSLGLGLGPYWLRRSDKDTYPLQEIEFEGHYLQCPHNPDSLLRLEYGDYMSLPSKDKLVPSHVEDVVLDLNNR